MIRIFFFLFGFGLMTIGPEIYLSLLGFIIINLTIFIKGDKKNGIYI